MDVSFYGPPNFPTDGWDALEWFVIVGVASAVLLPFVLAVAGFVFKHGEN